MTEFEKKVRHRLIDLGWTISRLADELGVSVSYVFEIMKGTRKAVDMKQKMCDLLGIEDEQVDS
jgi:transcriptional regulator with XRE-family HTH domain